ncbi:MAG: hypothetical protein HY924_06090 [Elusimicrobia bacterium]|nr:hypothetical protein [Elusimicrobiota bacterium]
MHLIAMLALALNASPSWAGKVTMCVDDACAKKIKREKLDCRIHDTKKKSLSLGFKMSVAFAAKVGPEVTWGRQTGVQWNGMSQQLISRYKVLCDMHNKSHLSVAEFDRRYEKLEGLYEKAVELKAEIEENVYQRAEKAFDDLDREAAKYSGGGDATLKDELKGKISKYSSDIETLAEEVKSDEPDAEAADSSPAPKAKKETGDR